MLKDDLVTRISEKTKITKKDTLIMVDATIEAILEGLGEDGIVRIGPSFGTFKVIDRAARKARNPHTGETIDVPPTKIVKFKPSIPMKEQFKI